MRRLLPVVVLLALAAGCKKKPAPPPVVIEETPAATDTSTPVPIEPSERDKLLAAVKTKRGPKQREAIEALANLAATDEATRDALLELLHDKTNAGAGKTHPTQISSTREAAVVVLLQAGPKGEAVLLEKGLPALRDGLFDRDPAVREHTARTLEIIGPAAKPLSRQLLRICGEDKDPQVRAIAFDALRTVGVSDVPGLASLLHSKDAETKRRAAEIIGVLPEVPPSAVSTLARALDDEDEVIRIAAAMAIGTAGIKGATKDAADRLVAAAAKGFPPVFDPKLARPDDPQFEYFTALGRMGSVAVVPLTDLLKHKNYLVRGTALQTLGGLGPAAKEAAKAIRDSLTDPEIPLEAAVALYRVGEEDLEAALRLVESALASTDPRAVIFAIDATARMGKSAAKLAPTVLKHLADKIPEARLAAVMFVGMMEPADAAKQVPEVAKLLADEQPQIRLQVGVVLAKLGPAAGGAAEAVGRALASEKDEEVREQLIDALIAMGPKAKPAVSGLASHLGGAEMSVPTRIKAIDALIAADPGSKETAAALVKAATDRDPFVRRAAAAALGKLNPLPDEARTALVKLLRNDSRGEVMAAAARALTAAGPRAKAAKPDLEAVAAGKMPGLAFLAQVALVAIEGDVRKAGGVVRAGLTDRNGSVRVAAAEALRLVGPTAADVPALLRISRDGTSQASQAAAAALGIVGPGAKDAVPRLIELLNDHDAPVRIAAAEALGKIGAPAALPAIPKLREARRGKLIPDAVARKTLEMLGVSK